MFDHGLIIYEYVLYPDITEPQCYLYSMAEEEVLEEIPREGECEKDCFFDVDEDYSNRLLENSLSIFNPCLCSSDIMITKTPYFLSSWDPCENHKGCEVDNYSFGGHLDVKEEKKRVMHRFPGSSGALPFGNEKKNEFVFQHYDRRDSYIEQYRYNHTFGGTGKSLRNAQIAQTLISYLKNGQLKFPIISGHDVNLVNSVTQFVETPDSSLQSGNSPTRNPHHEDFTPSPGPLGSTVQKSYSIATRSSHEGDSLVLPKIKFRENIQGQSKVKSCKERKGNAKGKRPSHMRSSGLVQPDDRPTDHDIKSNSYWWNNNELPYTGRKVVFPESKGRYSTLSTRSADFALVGSPDSKKKKRRPVRTSLGSLSNSGDLIQDLLNNRGKLATKETIQSLMKFFISDKSVKSDDVSNSEYETSKGNGMSGHKKDFDFNVNYNRRHGVGLLLSNDVTNELKVNGISSSNDGKRAERNKGSSTQSGRRHIKIPIRYALPLSKDTVLQGAPYRTVEQHRHDQENSRNKEELLNSVLNS
ncbi:uncharacterized protein [Amphiura filiformis]|uniref:uncharacterized protein isoform X1 n=1 Tax=Amphiura filiformis TaxID=82378 RepID=UPI003B222571